jgi:hypothetical protein
MGWLLLGGLAAVWLLFLIPKQRRSPGRTVEDFGRNMDLLADTGSNGSGRSALSGLAPPLRVMWYVTAALLVAFGVYVWMLVTIKAREGDTVPERVRATAAPPERVTPARQRYAADASSRTPRPAFNGLSTVAADDLAAIVVRPARERYA